MVDRYTVRYLPNASILQLSQAQTPSQTEIHKALFIALGDTPVPPLEPLPATREEVEAAAQLFPQAQVLVESSATKENVLRQAADYNLIHFATHGLLDYENPLFSALVLVPGKGEDAGSHQLTLAEILEHSFPAQVVTLSACQTAVSDVGLNDELMNLSRGFLLSGARQVVASLWSVDDESTALLMQEFYRALAERAEPAEALRSATVSLRRKHEDPFFWAPFILISSN